MDTQQRHLPSIIKRRFQGDTAERACRILWEIEKGGDEGVTVREIKKSVLADYQAIKYILRKLEELEFIVSETQAGNKRSYVYQVTPNYLANVGSLRLIYDRGAPALEKEGEDSEYSYMFYNKASDIVVDINTLIGSFATSTISVDKMRLVGGLLLLWGMNARGYNVGIDRAMVRGKIEENITYFDMLADIHRQILASDYLAAPGLADGRAPSEIYSPLTKDGEFQHKEVEEKTGWNRELAAQTIYYVLQDAGLREQLGKLKTETLEVTLGVILDKLSE